MKALRFGRTGDLAHLALAECPAPFPSAGELLVRVKAAGLNRSDVSNVMGGHPYTTLPRTPGRDFAGVVESGPAALVGRAVWGTGKELGFTRDGSHAEFVLLPAEGVALKPERLSFVEAASCGVPYVTASHALAGMEPGAKLLVIGAAGAVGVAATHLARLRGAQVTGAVRRSEQAARLTARGFGALLLREGKPLEGTWDLIIDASGHWLTPAIGALERFGRVVVMVSPGDGRQMVPVRDLYRRGASIGGVNSLLYSSVDCARLLSDLRPQFESGALPPPDGIEEKPLAQGAEAYAALKGGWKGKLVLVP